MDGSINFKEDQQEKDIAFVKRRNKQINAENINKKKEHIQKSIDRHNIGL